MSTRDRTHAEQRVMLAAEPLEVDALLLAAPELEIMVTAPRELIRWAVDLRSRAAVWALPDADAGLRLMTALHVARPDSRLLFVTPPEAAAQRLAALEAGVDEVATRPISASELAGRMRLLLRRARPLRGARTTMTIHARSTSTCAGCAPRSSPIRTSPSG